MTEPNNQRYTNYNDFSNPNPQSTNILSSSEAPNFQLIQHFNQPYHDLAINKPVHPRLHQQAGNVLFVADLPEETCEEDLMNIFKDYQYVVGRVTNGTSKTFALAHFKSAEWAEKARNDLNGMKLEPKYARIRLAKPIRLCRWETKVAISERREDDFKKNLLVKNLSKDVTAHFFWNLFKNFGDVRSSKLAVDFAGNSKGFGYVTFYNLVDAEAARNALNGKEEYGKKLSIEFLQPGLKKTVRKNNVYVKHFPKENFSIEELKKIFTPYGEVLSVLVAPDRDSPGLNKGFGFVCFRNIDDAERAQRDLNGKKIWEGQLPIYVNFAMKKEERLEHLQRKKEELKRNSSRMTVFCKIKDNCIFNNENEFNAEIMKFLTLCFGSHYYPRSLKTRLDTRTAFVTMNSVNEVDLFAQFFTDLSKNQDTKLYFNPYKSKVERINASTIMKKKYNDFSGPGVNIPQVQDPRIHQFKNYNNFFEQGNLGLGGLGNMGGMGNIGGMGNFGGLNIEQMLNMQMMMQQQQLGDKFKNYNNFNNSSVEEEIKNVNALMNNMNINNMNNLGMNPMGPMSQVNPMMMQGKERFVNYNNFGDSGVEGKSGNVNNTLGNNNVGVNFGGNIGNIMSSGTPYNNNKVNNNVPMQDVQNEGDLRDEILDKIYYYVSQLYKEDASKITGMIAELSLTELREMEKNEEKLESVVKTAYHQLHN